MKAVNVMLGVVAGAAAGLVVGVLFAPERGSYTRQKLLRKGEAQVDAIKEKFNHIKDGVTGNYEKVKDDVTGLADKGKAKFHDYAQKANQATT